MGLTDLLREVNTSRTEFFRGVKMGRKTVSFLNEDERVIGELFLDSELPKELSKYQSLIEYIKKTIGKEECSLSEHFGFAIGTLTMPLSRYRVSKKY